MKSFHNYFCQLLPISDIVKEPSKNKIYFYGSVHTDVFDVCGCNRFAVVNTVDFEAKI